MILITMFDHSIILHKTLSLSAIVNRNIICQLDLQIFIYFCLVYIFFHLNANPFLSSSLINTIHLYFQRNYKNQLSKIFKI